MQRDFLAGRSVRLRTLGGGAWLALRAKIVSSVVVKGYHDTLRICVLDYIYLTIFLI